MISKYPYIHKERAEEAAKTWRGEGFYARITGKRGNWVVTIKRKKRK